MQNSKFQFKIQNFQKTLSSRQRRTGFTLIELLIVVAIIGILTSLLMVNFIGIRQRARDSQRKSDLRQIQSALELYRADQGAYPTALLSCGSSLTGGSPAVTYMQKIPCDPLDHVLYEYDSSPSVTGYSLTACLENAADNDPHIERNSSGEKENCEIGGSPDLGRFKFTLTNP